MSGSKTNRLIRSLALNSFLQMKSLIVITSLLVITNLNSEAQDQEPNKNLSNRGPNSELPYDQIPSHPDLYAAGTVAARIVDGLGFRYYWATDGLREDDMDFRPSKDGRSMKETLDHLYGLSLMIANAQTSSPNIRPDNRSEIEWEQKRRLTLENFHKMSQVLKDSKDKSIDNYKVVFQRGEITTEFPFWNLLNGPISDAIYHVGQIVTFRRSAGNPMNPGVNVFMGKTRE